MHVSQHVFKVGLRAGVICAWTLILVCWSLASPIGSSPDEDYHLANIYCANGYEVDRCEPSTYPAAKRVPSAILNAGSCFAVNQFASANCQYKSGVIEQTDLIDTIRLNYESDRVPYYRVANLMVSDDLQDSVIGIRILNIAVFLFLLILFAVFSSSAQFALLNLALLISMMPVGFYILSSVNAQSWQLSGLIFFWSFTYLIFTTKLPIFRFSVLTVLSALSALIAVSARSDALYFAGFYLIVMILLRGRDIGAKRLVVYGVIIVSTLLCSRFLGISQSTNFVSQGFGGINQSIPSWDLLFLNLSNISELVFGVFGLSDRPDEGYIIGGLGALDTPMPHIASLTLTIIFVGLIVLALRHSNIRLRIALVVGLLMYVILPLYVLQRDNIVVGAYLQPRYLLPITFLLAVLASSAIKWEFGLSKSLLWASVIFVSIAHGLFFHALLRRYTVGNAGSYFALEERGAWWWSFNQPGPYLTLAVSSVSVMLLGSILIHILFDHSSQNRFNSQTLQN